MQPRASKPTIFVIDDDSSVRRSLVRLINSTGWNVESHASAREFLDRPAYTGSGCVVLDVSMPEMSGPELHEWMNAHGIFLPVIFLTAHGDLPTGIQAMKRGAVDFLQKPVDDVLLLQTIQNAIEKHGSEQKRQQQKQEVDNRLSRLSPRERQVLEQVISGQLNKQIADSMGISIKTVKVHRARVMEKLEVDSLAALVHICEAAGMSFPQVAG
jgi:RNA polymerase sigma factor (sigma-70 family)